MCLLCGRLSWHSHISHAGVCCEWVLLITHAVCMTYGKQEFRAIIPWRACTPSSMAAVFFVAHKVAKMQGT